MARQARLDIPLASEQRKELDVLAAQTGVPATTLGRLAITQLLSRADLVLTGAPAGPGDDLDAFVAEVRADPRVAPLADRMAAAFAALDLEADPNRNAAGLVDCLQIVARARGSIEKRLAVMAELIEFRGEVKIPRELLHPKRAKGT